jgi:hypothetical protein
MKKIINKIKEILTADVGKSLDRLGLWDLFYNVFEFICVKIIYNTYRFTLRPFVIFLDSFFSSFKKTKIAILIWMLTFNFFVHVGTTAGEGSGNRFNSSIGFNSSNYHKNSKTITTETLAGNIVKLKYHYENENLEECKNNYDDTLKQINNINDSFFITVNECYKTMPNMYSYKITAEASYIDKFLYKIESWKASLPYYFIGVAMVVGGILLSPFILLANI